MIQTDQLQQAMRALHRLIVHAKAQAYEVGDRRVAELLNDIELLPEVVADDQDRTGEMVEMLQGIARAHPDCRYIIEEFERVSASAT